MTMTSLAAVPVDAVIAHLLPMLCDADAHAFVLGNRYLYQSCWSKCILRDSVFDYTDIQQHTAHHYHHQYRPFPRLSAVLFNSVSEVNHWAESRWLRSQHSVTVYLSADFTGAITPALFPNDDTITRIDVGCVTQQLLVKNLFPPTLKDLRLYDEYRGAIDDAGIFPLSLQVLHTDHRFQQSIDPRLLPSTLTELDLGSSLTSLSPHCLPPNLRVLRFQWLPAFTLSEGVLPPQLEVLHLSNGFNQRLAPNILPATLKHFTLRTPYNQPFDAAVLPQSLEKLKIFSLEYDQLFVAQSLPSNLRVLFLGSKFNQDLDGCLPASLMELHVGDRFNQPITAHTLPSSLRVLVLGDSFDSFLSVANLPSSLVELQLGAAYNRSVSSLPHSLRELRFSADSMFDDRAILSVLPSTLRVLRLPSSWESRTIDMRELPADCELWVGATRIY